ncbi:hypothetical protein EOE67_10970 [Rheinheimera riviphila]|uniref:Uncharacterized protein n=1 Tax=Rheinheimera riviphila TaxID=1834037 RepID=A0A437QSD0_9GAMM|nr:hypothetical protein [Rheinheimera riviphila]RVU37394.1 hypothetical protein EOE67_10970 [Rheinheimera riviphila]
MKMFQLALLVIGSFGAGFLLADGLAKSAPELVFVKGEPTAVTSKAETVKCAAASMAVIDEQPDKLANKQHRATKRDVVAQRTVGVNETDIAMPLESYSALVASQQRPATQLILQIDDADFAQMIEQQQQDQQFDAQSELYQQQLSEFINAHPEVVQPQYLTCSSRFCLLELEVQNFAAWPALFKTLTAQQWWQSISYQSAAESVAEIAAESGADSEQQSRRITLLLQQDWVLAADPQQLAVADGGQFD